MPAQNAGERKYHIQKSKDGRWYVWCPTTTSALILANFEEFDAARKWLWRYNYYTHRQNTPWPKHDRWVD